MLRNIRNIRNICKLRGVINSDTPKRVSRFVTPPLQGVSRFATVPWAVSQIGRVHSQTSALIWCSGIRKRLRKLRKLRMSKMLRMLRMLRMVF